MSKTVIFEVEVMFGDCDPAGIVFFPNFSKWMDASSFNFFRQCGVPPWRELVKTTGIIGTPLLGREKTFVQRHIVKRGDDLLCEGTETRAFCVRVPGDEFRIKAIPVPDDIKALCT